MPDARAKPESWTDAVGEVFFALACITRDWDDRACTLLGDIVYAASLFQPFHHMSHPEVESQNSVSNPGAFRGMCRLAEVFGLSPAQAMIGVYAHPDGLEGWIDDRCADSGISHAEVDDALMSERDLTEEWAHRISKMMQAYRGAYDATTMLMEASRITDDG